MRLDHLHLQNFRCYEDAHFDFQPGFNLVVGVNGSGKTSLLLGVAASFRGFLDALGAQSLNLSEADVRSSIIEVDSRFRFEKNYPVELQARGDAFDLPAWQTSLERNALQPAASFSINVKVREFLKDPDIPKNLPLLAVYRAGRRWVANNAQVEHAAKMQNSRLDAYTGWFDAAANLQDFESWFIGKTLERLQKISRKGHVEAFDDELAWVTSAIQSALELQSLEYDLDLRSLIVNLENRLVPFNDLSDGQRGMVALFADIARRICLLNPHLGKAALAQTCGIVIIDELDIHLHPGWQRDIAPALKKAFPKIQFIAASHSPQIIGSLRPDEVMLLHDGEGSHPRATYGLDSSRILEAVMGTAQRDPEIENSLNELLSTLGDNNLEKARQQLAALKEKAPDLPEFAGAEALIRRKEMLGR